jgi:hypothetical protein
MSFTSGPDCTRNCNLLPTGSLRNRSRTSVSYTDTVLQSSQIALDMIVPLEERSSHCVTIWCL